MNIRGSNADRNGKNNDFLGLFHGRGITLKQIRYFLAVAYNGGINSAACNLYVSPGTITESVKKLENTLGVPLLHRLHSGMSLTQEGGRFLEYCEKILFLLDDAMSAIEQPSVKGKLRISASPVVLGYFLPSLYMRFRQTYPAVEIELQESHRPEIEDDVLKNTVDIGILIVSNISDNKMLQRRTLFSFPRFLWCSAGHQFAIQKAVSMDDIANEPYIQLCNDEAQENTQQFWEKNGMKPKIIVQTEMVEAVRSYVGNGTGVTILANMLFRPWSLEEDRLVVRPVVNPIPNMDIGMIWRKEKKSSLTNLFIDFLLFHCRRGNLDKFSEHF